MNSLTTNLSQMQLMCLQGRALGYNIHKMGEITGRVPSTMSEHLLRAYGKLNFRSVPEIIEYLESKNLYITAEVFEEKYGRKYVTPVSEIKERTEEQKRQDEIHKAQSEVMSQVHEEVGNNIYARYQ